jgi:xanthine dehydrogenase YagT iron-sulfur-binding subunit
VPKRKDHSPPLDRHDAGNVSRRSFIQTIGVSAAAGAIRARADASATSPDDGALPTFGPEPTLLALTVNGRKVEATIEPCTTLMEALRWHFNLTGTKEVCDRGSCGACSVLVDGKLVVSCMMLAVDAAGSQITTVEGLDAGGSLDLVQEAFIRHDALQCGFCTPGLVMACKALLASNPQPSLDQIKAGLAGNICRCGTYTNVFNAVLEASGQSPVKDEEA